MDIMNLLKVEKPAALRRFLQRTRVLEIPEGILIPEDPEEAILLGMRIAQRRGYEEGFVDGVDLGVKVLSGVLSS